jgi:hypothetical protein
MANNPNDPHYTGANIHKASKSGRGKPHYTGHPVDRHHNNHLYNTGNYYVPSMPQSVGGVQLRGIGDFHAGKIVRLANYKCYPLIAWGDYDSVQHMELSNLIIAPQSLLSDLVGKYRNLCSTHVFQINSAQSHFTVGKYYEAHEDMTGENGIYVPSRIFDILGIEYGNFISLKFINQDLPKGTKVILQPETDLFLNIEDHQMYFQKHMQENYTTLSKGETLLFPYFEDKITMIVTDLEPNDVVSIIDTDLILEFAPSLERIANEKKQELARERERELERVREREREREREKNRERALEAEKKEQYAKLKNQSGVQQPFVFNPNADGNSQPTEFTPFQGNGNVLGKKSSMLPDWMCKPMTLKIRGNGAIPESVVEQLKEIKSRDAQKAEMLAHRLAKFSKPYEKTPVAEDKTPVAEDTTEQPVKKKFKLNFKKKKNTNTKDKDEN